MLQPLYRTFFVSPESSGKVCQIELVQASRGKNGCFQRIIGPVGPVIGPSNGGVEKSRVMNC